MDRSNQKVPFEKKSLQRMGASVGDTIHAYHEKVLAYELLKQ